METDRVRRAAACDEQPVAGAGFGKLTFEPKDEGVHAVVGDEEIRAEPDREHVHPTLGRPDEGLLELFARARPREVASRPADPDRRQAAEWNVLLDLHASSSSRSGTARSTSPAPTVTATSPGRARRAMNLAPSSTLGVQPTVIPGRASATASTTSFPLTPSTGSSRAR